MALNAVLMLFNSEDTGDMKSTATNGESKLAGDYKGWIELQGWDWEVESESSWTKGGGASVGKPNPQKMTWEHYFDKSSCKLLEFMCKGQAFPRAELHMLKSAKAGNNVGQVPYFKMAMLGTFITKVSNSATEEGNVLQKVEMVFKDVAFHYRPQKDEDGSLDAQIEFGWNIPSGVTRGFYKK
jgi:type VI secretion system secreted protein Hcp